MRLNSTRRLANTDGSSVTTDKDGHVTRVVNTSGSTRDMTYENGKLVEISMGKDGSLKKEGAEWVERNAKGEETHREKCDISFKKDGTRVVVTGDGTRFSAPDGSSRIIFKDNSQLAMDPDKRVTKIVDSDGNTTNIKYGRAGRYNSIEPVEIADKDGSTWKRDDETWYQYRGGEPTGDAWHGQINVSEDGQITRGTSDGDWVETRHPDGSITRGENPRETRDKYGQVVEQFYRSPYGNRDTIISYKNGQLTDVEIGPNYTWKRMPDGKWQKEVGGEEPGPPQDVQLRMNENGDLVVTTKGGKPLEVAHRDGTVTKSKQTR